MQPLKSYNRMQMQLASSAAFPEPLLAAMPQLKEKPHMGVPSKNPALYQGHEVCNSTTALGLQAALHLERIRSRYTGKERDTESGLDNFEARYYGSNMGRMMSPDPLPWAFWQNGNRYDQYRFRDYISNPQNFNMYAYVLNNPLSYTDPTGMTCQTNSSDGNTYDDMDGKGCATVDQQDADRIKNGQYDATVHGGSNAAQLEVNDAVGSFLGNGPKNIDYLPNDPFTLSFQKSAGMDAINAKITANCSASSGKLGVGSGEAFVNTVIDGVFGGEGFHTPEAQLGAFNATYSHDGFTATVTVTNPISLNSAAYHATSAVGIQNPKSGPLGTVHQTLHISEPDPCNGHT